MKQLYEFLSSYKLPRDIAAEFEYSNLGGGLLGHVLALVASEDYALDISWPPKAEVEIVRLKLLQQEPYEC